jgi:hypothetical protein
VWGSGTGRGFVAAALTAYTFNRERRGLRVSPGPRSGESREFFASRLGCSWESTPASSSRLMLALCSAVSGLIVLVGRERRGLVLPPETVLPRRSRHAPGADESTLVILLTLHADGTMAGCTEDDERDGCRGRDERHDGSPKRCIEWSRTAATTAVFISTSATSARSVCRAAPSPFPSPIPGRALLHGHR